MKRLCSYFCKNSNKKLNKLSEKEKQKQLEDIKKLNSLDKFLGDELFITIHGIAHYQLLPRLLQGTYDKQLYVPPAGHFAKVTVRDELDFSVSWNGIILDASDGSDPVLTSIDGPYQSYLYEIESIGLDSNEKILLSGKAKKYDSDSGIVFNEFEYMNLEIKFYDD